jgi:preprotein translocase SecE subunit
MLALALFSYQGISEVLSAYGLAEESWQLLVVQGKSFYLANAVALFVALFVSFVAFRLVFFKPKPVDFLIDVESEMKKTVWPINPEGRTIVEKTRELRTSSFVVVCVVLFMAYVLFFMDKGLSLLMRTILS